MTLLKYWCSTHIVLLSTWTLLGTHYEFTRHLLNFTDARHILHFPFSAPEVCSASTDCSAPEHFYLAHTRFSICSTLIENSAQHELTCSTTTNEFSKALQTSLLQLIFLIFLSVTNLYILEYVINRSFYQCLNWSLYFITTSSLNLSLRCFCYLLLINSSSLIN